MQKTAKVVLVLVTVLVASVATKPVWSMAPFRKAFVFFAVHDGGSLIAVQSNPLLIQDDSESNSFTLTCTGAYTEPSGGGFPVPGLIWQNGAATGGLSSEGSLFATSWVAESHWRDHAMLYARFELRDVATTLVNRWDTPVFLRTIDTISFDFTQGGDPLPINIGGGLPALYPRVEYVNFEMDITPKGSLLGLNGGADADVRIDVTTVGARSELSVLAPPYDGSDPIWDVPNGPFDLTMRSIPLYNPDDLCEHHFNGLVLGRDLRGTPDPLAQPTLTLHPVPEPGTLCLTSLGLCAVALVAFRRFR